MKSIFGSSLKQYTFLKFIAKLGTFFGIVPSYDYNKLKLTYKILYKLYTLIIVPCTVCFSVISLYWRYIYEDSPVVFMIVDSAVEITGMVFFITLSLGSSLWNMKSWDLLLNQLFRIRRSENLTKQATRRSIIENPLTFFISGCVFYAVMGGYQYQYRSFNFVFRITQMWFHYVKFVLVSVMYCIMISIRNKYEDINNRLMTVSSAVVIRKDSFKVIRKIRILNLEADSMVGTFNSFFGWPILCIIAHSFGQILSCASYIISTSFKSDLPNVVLIGLYFAGNMGTIFRITSGSDAICKVSKEIFKNCCHIKTVVTMLPKQEEEMDRLQANLKIQAKFTAAGFFEINRSLWLSIFSSLTTYVIVIIQFNSLK